VGTIFDTKGFSMIRIGDQQTVNLLRFFDELPDPRSEVNRLHSLGDVIVTAICAVVAGADGPTAIAKWAELNEIWLKKHLKLPNGTPRKDTFRRVLSSLDPIVFQQCFGQWLESLRAAGGGESNDGESKDGAMRKMRHVAIDGKTLRRSHDKKNGLGPLHVVSAWASDRGITLGQTATDEKSNEITAIPELLKIIDVEDAVVTIDAAGCQKNIAGQVENTLHWSLDMTYREDESRVRDRRFAENLAWLRRMTLSLIKRHPSKDSNVMKRRMAGWNVDFLMQILTGKGT